VSVETKSSITDRTSSSRALHKHAALLLLNVTRELDVSRHAHHAPQREAIMIRYRILAASGFFAVLFAAGAGAQSAAGLLRRYFWFLFQPVEQGALPILYAATAEEAEAGAYYGPDKLGETRGFPAPARVPRQALDRGVAERLWQASEQLAGVRFT
jgi:hypothetical protein